jgi:hypothetical protein
MRANKHSAAQSKGLVRANILQMSCLASLLAVERQAGSSTRQLSRSICGNWAVQGRERGSGSSSSGGMRWEREDLGSGRPGLDVCCSNPVCQPCAQLPDRRALATATLVRRLTPSGSCCPICWLCGIPHMYLGSRHMHVSKPPPVPNACIWRGRKQPGAEELANT